MITLPQAKGKRYGVIGLGKSGRATIESLLASGATVLAGDDSKAACVSMKTAFPEIDITPVAKWDFSTIDALIMSPGIFLDHPAVLAAKTQGVEVIGDIELLYRAQPNARYIAITGTNGKSTTTSLIGHILKACGKKVQVGGNIGIPALALEPLSAGGIYVLELSSYQLDLIATTRFQTAILLNITPDHLDHHGGMQNYIDAKLHIFDRQRAEDVAIIGIDDTYSETIAHTLVGNHQQRVIPISVVKHLDQGVQVHAAQLTAKIGMLEGAGDISVIRTLQGAHNGQNAAAAYAACAMNGCQYDDILEAMATYPGLAHRMEWLGEINGVHYVNDSKATNADAAEKALLTYDHIYWIAGGVAKDGGIETLNHYFHKIRHAYLIGEAANDFAKTLEGHVPYTISNTLENAFQAASAAAMADTSAPTRSVVLAPACASFDQFPNFEKRGEAFVALFDQLKGAADASAAR